MAREPEGSSSYPLKLDAVGSTFFQIGAAGGRPPFISVREKRRSAVAVLD
jgi:hypothetical protein